MSYCFTYYKDPGLLVDTIKLMSAGLNDFSLTRSLIAPISLSEENKREIDHIKTALKKMPLLPKELLLFFYKPNSTIPNFMSEFLLTLFDNNFNILTLNTFTKILSDRTFLKNKLLNFYFHCYPSSTGEVENLIRTSSTLPDNMKVYLLGFYVHPEPYFTQLISSLKQYYQRITQCYFYETSSVRIDEDSLTKLLSFDHHELKNNQTYSFGYSICHVMYKFLAYNIAPTQNWLITGLNFTNTVDSIINHTYSESIEKIFAALGDSHRLEIVLILHENGPQSTVDILNQLSIAPSSLSHHLRVLKKSGIITSTKSKTGFEYSLNRNIFSSIFDLFKILKGELQ